MRRRIVIIFIGLVLSALFFGLARPGQLSGAATDTAALSTAVGEFISIDITAGDMVSFGNLTPGVPIKAPATGTVVDVTTSASGGYNLALHDGSGSNSALRHTDTTTYIADYADTIAVPTSWTGTGAGITLYDAEVWNAGGQWGATAPGTYDSSSNKYAGIPAAATIAHTVTGYHEDADSSYWAFELDVPNNQKTGDYSGTITFTATAIVE